MRLLKISAAAVLALALMCGCSGGGAKNIDASKAAAEIVEKVEFEDELALVDSGIVNAVYGFDSENVYASASYMGSGATAEEVTVVTFKSLTDADKAKFDKRIESQKESYKSYNPDEMPKLSSPVIEFSGSTAILCVCNDSAAAKKVIDGIIGK